MRKIIFAVIAFLSMMLAVAPSQAVEGGRKVIVYFFWGDGCPHCGHEKPFLKELERKYPGLVVKDYEVWHNSANKEFYRKMSAAYGETTGSVPATFLDSRVWIGFNDEKSKEMAGVIEQCFQSGCLDPSNVMNNASSDGATVTVPFLGVIDASRISLPILTLVLAGLDGFNPCAFFVLLMLLSLMVHAQSRMRMLVVGGVFVFFSGFVYFLFMAAWLNLFMVTGDVQIITTAAGLVAVAIAIINIKDYFFFKQGVSLSISAAAQTSLLAKMRALIRTGSVGALVIGTVVLAVMANLYELLCTAGFPMVFTRALTLQKLSTGQYYLYLVFYNLIYVLPLLAIVLVFSSTLGSRKLTEQEGRVLKLVSGLMMLGMGGILVVRPALLNNVVGSLGLIIGVLMITAFIIWFGKNGKKSDR
ncbi:MAG: thioredoxin family protein [Candidatus Omnitrophota bacterium]